MVCVSSYILYNVMCVCVFVWMKKKKCNNWPPLFPH